jgi:hypothetical protein
MALELSLWAVVALWASLHEIRLVVAVIRMLQLAAMVEFRLAVELIELLYFAAMLDVAPVYLCIDP